MVNKIPRIHNTRQAFHKIHKKISKKWNNGGGKENRKRQRNATTED